MTRLPVHLIDDRAPVPDPAAAAQAERARRRAVRGQLAAARDAGLAVRHRTRLERLTKEDQDVTVYIGPTGERQVQPAEQPAGGASGHKGCGWCGGRAPQIGQAVDGWTVRKLPATFRWGPITVPPCDWFGCPACSVDLAVDPPHIGAIVARRGGPSTSDRQALTLALVAALGPAVPLADYAAEPPEENQ